MTQSASETMKDIRAQLAPFLDGRDSPNRQASIATALYVTSQLVSLVLLWIVYRVVMSWLDSQRDVDNIFDAVQGLRLFTSYGFIGVFLFMGLVVIPFWLIFGCSLLAARPLRKQGVRGTRVAAIVAPLPGLLGLCLGPLGALSYPLYWVIFRALIRKASSSSAALATSHRDASPAYPAAGASAAPGKQTLSPDGYWAWDGTTWQPSEPTVSERAVSAPTDEPLFSADSDWAWDGTAWQPTGSNATFPSVEQTVSPDGHWVWDGVTWQPNSPGR